jgi:hypothetical protein
MVILFSDRVYGEISDAYFYYRHRSAPKLLVCLRFKNIEKK